MRRTSTWLNGDDMAAAGRRARRPRRRRARRATRSDVVAAAVRDAVVEPLLDRRCRAGRRTTSTAGRSARSGATRTAARGSRGVAGPHRGDRDDRLELQLDGHERRRRRDDLRGHEREVAWRDRASSAIPAEDVVRLAAGQMSMPAYSGGTGCTRKPELGDDAEVAAAAAQAPHQVGVAVVVDLATEPSARTIWAPTRLSQASPWRRDSQPMPPPRVSPATPVWEISPPGLARPCCCVAASYSPQSRPGCGAGDAAGSGSTSTPLHRRRGRSSPRPRTRRGPGCCGPRRAPRSRGRTRWPCATAAATSAAVRQRAMSAGKRSTVPFQTCRASS